MKLLKHMKDGGPESKVDGYWLVEIKSLFSIVLLHFSPGSRDAFHSHAFNAISWLIRGKLNEHTTLQTSIFHVVEAVTIYIPSIVPIVTPKSMFHRVVSVGDSWVISFRGPWSKTWKEYIPATGENITLTHGRQVVVESIDGNAKS